MTPRDYARRFQVVPEGLPVPPAPVEVVAGDTVGVVLMNLGGPSCREDVEPFLYNRLMDPAETDWRLPRVLRHLVCRVAARRRARPLADAYHLIGGDSPLARHTAEQARAVEHGLAARYANALGVRFRAYVAMRHWHPSTEEAAAQMAADGVTKVVLLPLHPHYAAATTGSSLAYWDALEAAGEIPRWPRTMVPEFALHPGFVQALAERVDEGLQRFPRAVRPHVQVVFTAPAVRAPRAGAGSPACGLVHATVEAVVRARATHDPGRATHVAFARALHHGRSHTPDLEGTLAALADDGHTAALVVPVSFVSDRVETAHDLDVVVRAKALAGGFDHFEVSNGLNAHPLFVGALLDCVAAQLRPDAAGDGATALLPVPLAERLRHSPGRRCAACDCEALATRWEPTPDVPEVWLPRAA